MRWSVYWRPFPAIPIVSNGSLENAPDVPTTSTQCALPKNRYYSCCFVRAASGSSMARLTTCKHGTKSKWHQPPRLHHHTTRGRLNEIYKNIYNQYATPKNRRLALPDCHCCAPRLSLPGARNGDSDPPMRKTTPSTMPPRPGRYRCIFAPKPPLINPRVSFCPCEMPFFFSKRTIPPSHTRLNHHKRNVPPIQKRHAHNMPSMQVYPPLLHKQYLAIKQSLQKQGTPSKTQLALLRRIHAPKATPEYNALFILNIKRITIKASNKFSKIGHTKTSK